MLLLSPYSAARLDGRCFTPEARASAGGGAMKMCKMRCDAVQCRAHAVLCYMPRDALRVGAQHARYIDCCVYAGVLRWRGVHMRAQMPARAKVVMPHHAEREAAASACYGGARMSIECARSATPPAQRCASAARHMPYAQKERSRRARRTLRRVADETRDARLYARDVCVCVTLLRVVERLMSPPRRLMRHCHASMLKKERDD